MYTWITKLSISFLILFLIACQDKENELPAGEKNFTFFGIFANQIFDDQFTVFKKAQELTGVSLKSIVSQNATDSRGAFNLMIASGDLPDIIKYLGSELDTLGIDGGVIPLETLIGEHAPNITEYWKENSDLKKMVIAYDKHIYYVPYYRPKGVPGSVFFVRQDWLDKLGLTVPTTIDDFYNVLKAFRTQDPNGNGKTDEIPFFMRALEPIDKMNSLLTFFQLKAGWQITKDKISYDPSILAFKNAIKELSKWYSEGLIDPEVFTRDYATARDYMFGNNLGGMTEDWASTASYINALKDTIPGFNLTVILPPLINGKRETVNQRLPLAGGWSISSSAQDPVSIIKYFDFWFSEEGNRLWNFGIEGDHYTMVDGKPIFTDKILKAPNPTKALLDDGAQWVIGTYQDYEYERQFTHPIVVEGYNMYIKENAVRLQITDLLKYPSAELQELKKINAELDIYITEMAQKWLLGASDVDQDWDAYISHLTTIGLPRALEIQQKALILYRQ